MSKKETNDGTPISDALIAFNKACKAHKERRLRGIERARNARLRREARAKGETTYHGTPCRIPGHGTLRVTYNGLCHQCHTDHNKAYRARKKAEMEALRAAVAKHGLTVEFAE